MKSKDIAALEQILLQMEGSDEPARMAADRQFHRYIAASLDNKALLRLMTGLLDQGYRPLARQFATHFDSPKTWTAVLAEHRNIVAALAARNPERARKAMRDHLRKVHIVGPKTSTAGQIHDSRRRI